MKMTLEATSTYLRETWSASLKSGVRSALKEVGKGWFNLDERSAEVDAVSKRRSDTCRLASDALTLGSVTSQLGSGTLTLGSVASRLWALAP